MACGMFPTKHLPLHHNIFLMFLSRATKVFHWTNHAHQKMRFYRLSEQRVKRVISNAVRREEGVAPNTIALMQRHDSAKRKEEIWVMVQTTASRESRSVQRTTVISAWRYPGITKPGKAIPMPDGLLEEILGIVDSSI